MDGWKQLRVLGGWGGARGRKAAQGKGWPHREDTPSCGDNSEAETGSPRGHQGQKPGGAEAITALQPAALPAACFPDPEP